LRLRAPHRLATGNLILLGLEVLQFQLVKDAETPASPHAPGASAPRPHPGFAPGQGHASALGVASAVDRLGLDAEATHMGGRSPAALGGVTGLDGAAARAVDGAG